MLMRISLGALLLALPAIANAQTMNAEQFYRTATSLQKKGPLAIFSMGQIKKLMGEGQAAAKVAADERRAALKAGRTPPGPAKMDDKEFMARLSAIPAAERAHINMAEAMNRILARKFPCKS